MGNFLLVKITVLSLFSFLFFYHRYLYQSFHGLAFFFQAQTARNLDFLKQILESHGSVEGNAISKTKCINKSGVYCVGFHEDKLFKVTGLISITPFAVYAISSVLQLAETVRSSLSRSWVTFENMVTSCRFRSLVYSSMVWTHLFVPSICTILFNAK